MKNKLGKVMIVLITLIFLSLPIDALGDLGRFQQGQCVNISQTCTSCTYINISSISNRNNFTLVENVEMTSFGNGEWRYEFCETLLLGRYDVKGQGDIDSVDDSFTVIFEITPSGEGGTENQVYYLLAFALVYFLGFFGFFSKTSWLSALGGIAMFLLGLFILENGLIIFRGDITLVLSYITMGLGALFFLVPAIETIQDNL